jgi:hypothetical protein
MRTPEATLDLSADIGDRGRREKVLARSVPRANEHLHWNSGAKKGCIGNRLWFSNKNSTESGGWIDGSGVRISSPDMIGWSKHCEAGKAGGVQF